MKNAKGQNQHYATKKDVEEIVSKSTDKIMMLLGQFATDVDKRFTKVDKRFENIENRLFNIEKKQFQHDEELRKLNKKYDHLVNTIDGFISRIDRYETELAARDNQFAKLLEWARKVSKKTGIPLENL